jgi:ectoine hydroxylase-related dioxygenase (phytanoyl-CoA dioxygenase family)
MPVAAPLAGRTQQQFERQGWVAVPSFYAAGEVATIQQYTDELSALPEVSGAQMVYREDSRNRPGERIVQRVEDFCAHHAGFNALIHGRLKQAVEGLLGEAAVLFKEKINYKLPGGAGFEPHQDQQAGWSSYAPLFVTALVSIDATTLANGCLELALGARRERLMGAEWQPLSAQQLAGVELVPVPTLPGDVLFFDSFAPHASKANTTTSPRRVLYVTYNALSLGDHRAVYYADKRAAFPPDIDRIPGVEYHYRV